MKNFLLPAFLFSSSLFYAQGELLQQVSPCSAFSETANGNIGFILGEISVMKQTDNLGNTIGGGMLGGAAGSSEILNVSDLSANQISISLYPNPAVNLVNIRFNYSTYSVFRIKVLNAEGRIVSSETYKVADNSILLNAGSWIPGMYFLELSDQNGTLVKTCNLIKTNN